MLVPTRALGVPNAGVINVGDVANTAEPLPVSSVSAPARLDEVNDPKEVALPTEVTAPVRLALVVTVPAVVAVAALPPIESAVAVPVMLVPTKEAGVPKLIALPDASNHKPCSAG